MECLVCSQTIHPGEQIFAGNQCICLGDTDWEYGCPDGVEELVGAIHLSCLQSPAAAITTTNTAPHELVEEEVVVKRSDALALFDL